MAGRPATNNTVETNQNLRTDMNPISLIQTRVGGTHAQLLTPPLRTAIYRMRVPHSGRPIVLGLRLSAQRIPGKLLHTIWDLLLALEPPTERHPRPPRADEGSSSTTAAHC